MRNERRSSPSDHGPVTAATEATLAALALPPTDRAQAELVRAYAREIDAAERRMVMFERLFDKISRYDEPDAYEALTAARGMLSARGTLDRVGARLQTGLDALRATPRARPMPPPRAPMGSPLGRLRLAAGTEVDRAGADDDGGPG